MKVIGDNVILFESVTKRNIKINIPNAMGEVADVVYDSVDTTIGKRGYNGF